MPLLAGPAAAAASPVPQAVVSVSTDASKVFVQFAEHVLGPGAPGRAALEATCRPEAKAGQPHCFWTSSDPAQPKQWLVMGTWFVVLDVDRSQKTVRYERDLPGPARKGSQVVGARPLKAADLAGVALPAAGTKLAPVSLQTRRRLWALARRVGRAAKPARG